MNGDRNTNKNKRKMVQNNGVHKIIFFAAIVVVVIACAAAAIVFFQNSSDDKGKESSAGFDTVMEETAQGSDAQKKESGETSEEEQSEESADSPESAGTVSVIEKADASYEEWLAAAMIIGISMQYENFKIDGIYLTGKSDVSSGKDSKGAYVVFTVDGEQIAMESKPLKAERTDSGTIDLYTKDLGFATFDVVDIDTAADDSYQEITIDDLETLISQSLLVSLYEH